MWTAAIVVCLAILAIRFRRAAVIVALAFMGCVLAFWIYIFVLCWPSIYKYNFAPTAQTAPSPTPFDDYGARSASYIDQWLKSHAGAPSSTPLDNKVIAQRFDKVTRLRAHTAQWFKDHPSGSDEDAYEEVKDWETARQGWIDSCVAAGNSEEEAEKSADGHFAAGTPTPTQVLSEILAAYPKDKSMHAFGELIVGLILFLGIKFLIWSRILQHPIFSEFLKDLRKNWGKGRDWRKNLW